MTAARRVVITGAGAVTPLGADLAATRAALANDANRANGARQVTGAAPATLFSPDGFRQTLAAEVKAFDARRHFRVTKALKLADRRTRLAVAAASMALEDAGYPRDGERLERLGILVGTSGSDLEARDLSRAVGGDPELRSVTDIPYFAERVLSRLNPLWLLVALPNMASAHVAIQLEARGPNSTVMTDWIAGTQAIGEAADWIRSGEADAVLAGGADSGVFPHAWAGFAQSGLFDEDGASFVPGEGAGFLLLEEEEAARRRGARVLGAVEGHTSGAGPVERAAETLAGVLSTSLRLAGIPPARLAAAGVSSISTSFHRAAEKAALDSALGPSGPGVPRLATPPGLGQTMAAAGPIDVALLLHGRAGSSPAAILWGGLGLSGQAAALALTVGETAPPGNRA